MQDTAPFCQDVSADIPALSRLTGDQLIQLYEWQKRILYQLAAHQSSQTLLEEICSVAEQMVPNAVASIMLYDTEECVLNVQAAPSLPPEAIDAFNGLKPGPGGGSCGNVVWQKSPQYVTSVMEDPRWDDIRDLAVRFNLGACWSHPIHGDGGEVIGTFALTSFETREPDIFQKNVLELGAYLASSVLKMSRDEAARERAAFCDATTDLPNRQKLLRDLSEVSAGPLTCFYVDLDHFQQLNDVFGHEAGDEALRQIARRLERLCDENDTVCYHFGGDAFVILSRHHQQRSAQEQLAVHLQSVIEQPIDWQGQQLLVTASMGIAHDIIEAGAEATHLIRFADTALSHAKQSHRRQWVYFEPAWQAEMSRRVEINMRLQQALRQARLQIAYQPLVDAQTGDVRVLEALVRWHDEQLGWVSPLEFISVAEASGLIHALTLQVVDKVIEEAVVWQANRDDWPSISINLSPLDLDAVHIERIIDRLKQSGLIDHVEFELTESLSLEQNEDAPNLIALVQREGVTAIAIDDFGSGYASLAHIKRLAANKIKVDQSLVRDMLDDPADQEIVRAAISMGHALGLTVVAEGVETAEHAAQLRQMGADLLQGYFISRPLPADEMKRWLDNWQGLPKV